MSVAPIESLRGLLTGHWAFPWLGRIGPGMPLSGAGTESQGLQLGSESTGLPIKALANMPPARFLEAGLPLNCSSVGLEPDHRASSGSTVGPSLVGLPPSTWRSMSPIESLHGQDCF